jgi:repressor LexA
VPRDIRLTPAQERFLLLLIDFRRREGVFPSTREILQLTGLKSPRSVTQFFDSLEEAGYVQRLPGARNLRILRDPRSASEERTETVRVPVVGDVAAGSPILAQENVEDYINVSRALARGSAPHFALRVHGDSMDQAGIADGDLILVRQQSTANTGERVVALIDDGATVKVFRPGAETIILEPRSSNAAHRPIILQHDFRIQGVVVAVIDRKDSKKADDHD